MKKALIALAALGLTGAAFAQSSVTLFGVVDANMRYIRTSGLTVKKLDSSGLNTSRFGVRGVEDLGGGLKASFWLESEVATDTGVAGGGNAFWGRRATVSLAGEFGEVRLGRNKTASRLHIEDFDPYTFTGVGSISVIYSNLGSGNATAYGRADNIAAYSLPDNIGGFYGTVDAAAGEGVNNNKIQTARLGFKQGPIHVSAAYANATNTAGNDKYKLASIAGSYDLGVAKPALIYTEAKYGARKQQILTASVTVPLGQGNILASYTDAKANADAEKLAGVGDAKLFAIGYVYNLSKRTALYTTYASVDNNGLGTFAITGTPTGYVKPGQRSSGFDVGISHKF